MDKGKKCSNIKENKLSYLGKGGSEQETLGQWRRLRFLDWIAFQRTEEEEEEEEEQEEEEEESLREQR